MSDLIARLAARALGGPAPLHPRPGVPEVPIAPADTGSPEPSPSTVEDLVRPSPIIVRVPVPGTPVPPREPAPAPESAASPAPVTTPAMPPAETTRPEPVPAPHVERHHTHTRVEVRPEVREVTPIRWGAPAVPVPHEAVIVAAVPPRLAATSATGTAGPPAVTVSIGRIEVRAQPAVRLEQPSDPVAPPAAEDGPSLSDFLRGKGLR